MSPTTDFLRLHLAKHVLHPQLSEPRMPAITYIARIAHWISIMNIVDWDDELQLEGMLYV